MQNNKVQEKGWKTATNPKAKTSKTKGDKMINRKRKKHDKKPDY